VPTLAEIVAYAERVLLCLHQQLTLGHLLITPSNFTTRGLLHEAMTLCEAYTVHMHILSNLWIQANVVPG